MVDEEEMRALVGVGRFTPTLHALRRMDERDVSAEDVRSVARTCMECRWQDANSTWRLTGKSDRGERLVAVIGAHAGKLTLVTVHWEREKA